MTALFNTDPADITLPEGRTLEDRPGSYYTSHGDTVYPVAVDHGGVTGVVAVTFQRPGLCIVQTLGAAHNNDVVAVTYRGKEYLVHQHFYQQDDGSWSLPTGRDSYISSVSPRGMFGGNATQTQTRKVYEAMAALIPAVYDTHQDAVLAGAKRDAQSNVDRAQSTVSDLEPKLAEAQAALKAAKAVLARLS
jgi:hypothetical protein